MSNKLWSAEVFASANKLWSAEVFASAHASAETDALQIRQLATEWARQITVLRLFSSLFSSHIFDGIDMLELSTSNCFEDKKAFAQEIIWA